MEPSSNDYNNDDTTTPTWDPELQIYVGGIVPGASNTDIQRMLESAHGTLRVFGYGSLCWNPGSPDTALGNPSVQSTLGHAIGYRRIWGQKSTDHRGVPSFPGVVCTLLTTLEVQQIRGMEKKSERDNKESSSSSSSSSSSTEGMIYSVPPSLAQQCLEELDFREKGGYAREIISVVEDETGKQVQALLYRGTPDNPAFSSRLTTDLCYASAVMAVAHGPSGPNHVYLHQLDEFLIQAKDQLQHHHCKQQDSNDKDNDATIIDDDTYVLADMTTALQKHELYFFCGAGSNQHGQIINYLEEDEDFTTLTESFVAVANDELVSATESISIDKPKQLFCGGGHSGLLTQQGKMYLWGWNQHGQCGTKSTKGSDVEVQCTELASEQQQFAKIPLLQPLSFRVEAAALGFSHTLVIEKETGKLYAFGNDSHGQVTGRKIPSANDGSSINDVCVPVVPDLLDANETFVAVSAGLFHSAAITSNGELITFGHSKYGQALMDGPRWKPPDGVRLVEVACGRHHTAMLDNRGRIWTMGENKFGQLGRLNENASENSNNVQHEPATTFKRPRPKKIDSIPQLVDGPFGTEQETTQNAKYKCVELQSGWSHIVARVEVTEGEKAITTTQLYGWGRCDKGQLGMRCKTVLSPTRLALGKDFCNNTTANVAAIACGSESTHILVYKDEQGIASEIYSVGWNEHGNLGLGDLTNKEEQEDVIEAARVPGTTRMVSPSTYSVNSPSTTLLAAGGAHFLAMRL